MAKKKNKSAGSKDLLEQASLYQNLTDKLDDSDRHFNEFRSTLSEKEAMFMGDLQDDYSVSEAKSQVFDPRLSTITIERSARVMANLPKGRVKGVSNADTGKSNLMNLTLDKYALPNANSQYPFLVKSRLWDIYSLMYGVMFALVDWKTDLRTGYTGPDMWLIPIRDAFPQAGAISIKEAEEFHVSTLVGKSYLKNLDKKAWNNIDELLDKIKEGGKSRSDMDSDRKSHVEETRHYDIPANKVELITTYKIYDGSEDKGEWITWSPDLPNKILRRIDNPHKNGELPIVAKHCFPLIDSIYGLGEFERGKTLQYAINSLINLYMDGVKMSIFPPFMVNPDGVVRSSIKMEPAAKWLVRSMDAAKQLNINPQGLQTFNSTYSFLIAALLNQAGTTDTAVTAKTDPGMGKTPQALKMLENRENSRDNWDKFMMEQAQEQMMRKFVNLIANKQSKKIKLQLFEDEIVEIAQVHEDIMEEFSDGNELVIPSSTFKDIKFDYQIIPGSTAMVDHEAQLEAMSGLLNTFISNPMFAQEFARQNKVFDIVELMTRIIAQSNINDWDKIVRDKTPAEIQEEQIKQQNQAMMQQLQGDPEAMQAAQQIQSIMGGMGSIPATPNGQPSNTP